ncbi:hypothetical protein KY290_032501 [Solanum tuberosum]|uniref:Uncharacterized protein n=1 Tax=Solanum tuberosum TaxID=4113 RepID=A0ABQ7UCA8_SOLTU|nr:hypothetical protein KY284_031510 [Solanum tuberosum]KAH0654221.1 hypothetical protein KY289_031899 [Solanum tuberosum]KAH0656845.1 hypothetical protein KY285_031727 [Solanum tuberosum]KAH0744508.1 hypothetical protein KY290_032501 [Solanum tuberosum]
MMKSPTKLLGKSVAPNSLLHGKFVAPKSTQYEAPPMKRTKEGSDPNAYRPASKSWIRSKRTVKIGEASIRTYYEATT